MTTVGILGGGQLARMMALAGAPLGLRFRVLDNVADACAGQFAPMIVGDYTDQAALAAFAAGRRRHLRFRERAGGIRAMACSERVPVFPNPRALAVAQDRLAEKTLFRELGIPVPDFADIPSRQSAGRRGRAPWVRRASSRPPPRLRRQRASSDQVAGRHRWRLGGARCAGRQRGADPLEGFVHSTASFLWSRCAGAMASSCARPLTENWHVDGVLSASLALARVAPALVGHRAGVRARWPRRWTTSACSRWSCSGKDGELLANELRPRVHNSGTSGRSRAARPASSRTTCARCSVAARRYRMVGLACMLNWIGAMPEASAVLPRGQRPPARRQGAARGSIGMRPWCGRADGILPMRYGGSARRSSARRGRAGVMAALVMSPRGRRPR